MPDHNIVSGKKYLLTSQNRGVAAENFARWNWMRLTGAEGDPGQAVIFHECPGGFKIEHTNYDYEGYQYWTLQKDGVRLDQWGSSTTWEVHATNHGIVIGKDNHTLNALKFGQRWIGGPESKYNDHDDYSWRLIKTVLFPIKIAETLIGKGYDDMADVEFALRPA